MKKTALFAALIAMLFSLVACGSTDELVGDAANAAWVTASNETLKNVSVTGFEYKGTAVPSWKYQAWAAASAPVVKEILNNMPDGYVLQVTGHADSRGPEEATGSKPGNMAISTDRAQAVYDALKNNGIESDKLTYKGVGSSMPLEGVASDSAAQRRVSFMVVPE